MVNFIGKQAPDFISPAIMQDNSLKEDFNLNAHRMGFRCVLFFYSLDFSYVCPAEILAFQNRLTEFMQRKTYVVGVSCDSHLAHLAWKKMPVEQGGIGQVNFPLVSDITRQICQTYDVQINDTVAHRATFILDEDGRVRHQSYNDTPYGRNIDEILRFLDAMDHHKATAEVCPPGWVKGDAGIKQTDTGIADYLQKNAANL